MTSQNKKWYLVPLKSEFRDRKSENTQMIDSLGKSRTVKVRTVTMVGEIFSYLFFVT